MSFFYNQTTKTYIVAFSKLFSDIHIKRYDSAGAEVKDIKVPLIYATKRKISYMLQQNPNTSSTSIVLPIIGFNIVALDYNSDRRLNSLNEYSVSDTNSIYEGMPWDYTIELTVRTKYQEDFWQVLEQLLYIFKPELSLDVKELKEFPAFIRDTKVILEGVSLESETELTQDEDSMRDFRAALSFKIQGYIYPKDTTDSIIEHIDVNLINIINETFANISHDWVPPDVITTITEEDGQ